MEERWECPVCRAVFSRMSDQAPVVKALMLLEATRWFPEGSVSAWQKTPEGENYSRVFSAMTFLRLALGVTTRQDEAVQTKPKI